MIELLAFTANLFVQIFAVASMLAVGLRYSIREILWPFYNIRILMLVLAANFIALPALAWAITRVIPLHRPFEIGLILVALAAGAPFVIKLTQLAEGTVSIASGILVLLIVSTIIYLPIAIPWILPGAAIAASTIAVPLLLTMLAPLCLGLVLEALVPALADRVLPVPERIANHSLVLVVVLNFAANLGTLGFVIGTGAILVSILLVGGAFIIGWLVGAIGEDLRKEMSLLTGQRNFGAAMVVGSQSFRDPTIVLMIVIVSLVSMAILFPAAHWMGRRARRETHRPTRATGPEFTGA